MIRYRVAKSRAYASKWLAQQYISENDPSGFVGVLQAKYFERWNDAIEWVKSRLRES